MSETESQQSGAQQVPTPVPEGVLAPGRQLRQAREAAGLHVAAVAGMLKVPMHKLEALEADDYAAFPDTVFLRALASSMCRSLGLEAAPILEQLPRSAPRSLATEDRPLNAPIKARAGHSGGGMTPGSGMSRKAMGAVLALLLGAAAVYFLPMGGDKDGPEGAVTAMPTAQPAAPAAATESLPQLPQETPVSPQTPPAPVTAAPVPSPELPVASVPVHETATVAAGEAANAPVLLFSATAPSWVQVRNARGAVVLQKSLTAGESVPVSETPPLAVVVGRVDATTLQVRGQTFDLAAVARENVARFEVK